MYPLTQVTYTYILISSRATTNGYWIGLIRNTSNEWYWHDGTTIDPTEIQWARKNIRSDAAQKPHILVHYFHNYKPPGWGWVDVRADNRKGYICMKGMQPCLIRFCLFL